MLQAGLFGVVALLALVAAWLAHDAPFAIHMGLAALIGLVAMVWQIAAARNDDGKAPTGYMDDVIRAGKNDYVPAHFVGSIVYV